MNNDKVAIYEKMTNKEIVRAIAKSCLVRIDNGPDYSRRGKRGQDAALNYFCGACLLAEISGNDNLRNYLEKVICFSVSIRGVKGVEDLVKE